MRAKSVIFFTILMGLSFSIVKGENDSPEQKFENITAEEPNYGHHSENFLSITWGRFQNALLEISRPYLLKKLGKLVSEHPMKSIVFAIVIGIVTNENKENIFEGIKKLRNSAYRVAGFGIKANEKNKKDEQRKEIKFVECENLNDRNIPILGKIFVLDA